MGKEYIILRQGLQNPFSRTVRDEKGEFVELLTFQPGAHVETSPEQNSAIANEIGNVLMVASENESGHVKFNPELTHACVVGIAKARLENGETLLPHQKAAMDIEADEKKAQANAESRAQDSEDNSAALSELEAEISEVEAGLKQDRADLKGGDENVDKAAVKKQISDNTKKLADLKKQRAALTK